MSLRLMKSKMATRSNLSTVTFAMAIVMTATITAGLIGCSSTRLTPAELSDRYRYHAMPHTIREVAEYDIPKMISLIQKEFNSKTNDDRVFFRSAVKVYAQTILIQPHFTEREASIRELKSKIEQSDYLDILPQAAEILISYAESENTSDQATANLALTNLVVEVRGLYKKEKDSQADLRALLVRIRDAKLRVSEAAKYYAHELVAELPSPSDEAIAALKFLDGSIVAGK